MAGVVVSEFFKSVREEWPVIRQAPRTFLISFLLLLSIGYGAIYFIFRENLSRKNDLIHTLQGQLEALNKGAGRSDKVLDHPPSSTGAATANGPGGIANTGSGNRFSTGQPPAIVRTEKR
ncbi:MAG: hypothetical protein ABSG26_17895 [Bryobacteraceae bacterium]|jgi:hypothetical protein